MLGDAVFNRVKRSDHKAISEISAFLRSNDLNIDTTVEIFITVTQHDKLVACGGIADNIIKCVAISPLMRGEGVGAGAGYRAGEPGLRAPPHSAVYLHQGAERAAVPPVRFLPDRHRAGHRGADGKQPVPPEALRRPAGEPAPAGRHHRQHRDERQPLHPRASVSGASGGQTLRLAAPVFSEGKHLALQL